MSTAGGQAGSDLPSCMVFTRKPPWRERPDPTPDTSGSHFLPAWLARVLVRQAPSRASPGCAPRTARWSVLPRGVEAAKEACPPPSPVLCEALSAAGLGCCSRGGPERLAFPGRHSVHGRPLSRLAEPQLFPTTFHLPGTGFPKLSGARTVAFLNMSCPPRTDTF